MSLIEEILKQTRYMYDVPSLNRTFGFALYMHRSTHQHPEYVEDHNSHRIRYQSIWKFVHVFEERKHSIDSWPSTRHFTYYLYYNDRDNAWRILNSHGGNMYEYDIKLLHTFDWELVESTGKIPNS